MRNIPLHAHKTRGLAMKEKADNILKDDKDIDSELFFDLFMDEKEKEN